MEKQKQHNDFVVSLSGANIDITIINIEEMSGYCASRGRLAGVVTEKQTYGELDKMNYTLVHNYTKPKPRVINTKDKQYVGVYNILSDKYHGGLLICESDTLSDSVSENLCNNESWRDSDVDLMVCRSFATVTDEELKAATFLRISADPEFNPLVLERLSKIFGEKVASIMIAQFFVNDNYESVNHYMEIQSARFVKEGRKDFIDYGELNKQLAYFIYYDVNANKLVNIDREDIMEFMKKMEGIIPVPKEQLSPFIEMITT
jgi:hypothetical protein